MFNLRNIIIGAVGIVLVVVILVGVGRNKGSENVVTVSADDSTSSSQVDSTAQQLFEKAESLKRDNNLVEARTHFQEISNDYPDFENIEYIEKELAKINMKIIFSNTPTEKGIVHEVVSGDTLGKLAKKYGTTIELIKISNHLKSDVIRLGAKLRIWTGTFNIYVDKSQNILILKDEDSVVKVYDVSTGKNNSTPVGEFKITTRLIDPVWFNQGAVVPAESPQNVLGTRWLGFDIPGYGIHGTVEPGTIGQQVTAGCVRMKNEDVEELYSIIPLKTKVVITD